jgi:hypothetical protein
MVRLPISNRPTSVLISSADVTEIPQKGIWFQLISNGTTMINDGPNGLQRLDKVVELAEKHGIYLLLSLTNNWNPLPGINNINTTMPEVSRRDVTPGTDNSLNRNFLSNDYGQCAYGAFQVVAFFFIDYSQGVWTPTCAH